MPLPAELQPRLDDPAFWRAYFWESDEDGDEENDDEDEEFAVELPVGEGYALLLSFDSSCDYISLEMRTPEDDDTVELGWDDQAHWHPDVLRWAELDLIARAVAVTDPRLPHPGPVLALTSRFVVLGPDDDPEAIVPLLDSAFPAAAGPNRTRDWLRRADGGPHNITWQQDADGNWAVDQGRNPGDRDLYSLRTLGSNFPYAAWQELLAAATATLEAAALPVDRVT